MASRRTIRVRFWLTEAEVERLNAATEKSGLSREAYIRTLLGGHVPMDKPPPDYFLMMRELHSIGNNLNQIAQRAHVTGAVDVARYERNAAELFRITARIVEATFEHRRLE